MAGDDVTIVLGGEPRELKYNWKSVRRLSVERGINILSTEAADAFGSPEGITALLWAGLIHLDPKLEVDQVDEWIELGRLEEISTAIGRAIAKDSGRPVDPTPSP